MDIVGKLYFYDEDDMELAMQSKKWHLAMWELNNWLRSKEKHESGLENKSGEELEHYVDAYCTVREELFNILESHDISL